MGEVRLLGEVAAVVAGRAVDLGPAKQRCVLAALAVDANRVVSVDRLTERLWGGDTPLRARATLLAYLSRLRRALAASGADIVRRPGGYALEVEPSAVDLHRFRDLHARARSGTDDRHAADLLGEALDLWRGDALTGIDGTWAAAERDRLHRERLDAEYDLTDALLGSGHGEDLVAGLAARAAEHPLDERVAGQHMLALHRAGRTSAALAHYRQLRERLVEELGTDPGPAVRDLHQRILDADPTLAAAPATTTEPAVVPRQLPAAPAPFVGRHHELDRLDTTLRNGTGTTVVISAIAGTGGIGKTWLALHWAHRNADRFPDGQLFVDLRGFSPDSTPMDPAVAVRGFLTALGVEPGRIPLDLHAQAALFRSLVADKRMLLVLDNAADAAQVAPLLPGTGTCTVVVTSRSLLPGLITGHGAGHLSVDTLADTEAHGLLTARLGTARTQAEPEAVAELVRLCGGFPLALAIIAGRAHTHPHLSLTALAAELHDGGLDALDDTDPTASLPTVLSTSHNALTDEQAEVFGLLAVAPGPDIGLPAAASLTDLPPARTTAVLRALEQASLITRDARGRYRMHDLVRDYATATAHSELSDKVREAALDRVVDFYLRTADSADRLVDPHADPIRSSPPTPGAQPHPLPDRPAAMAWLDTEHPHLLAAQHTAAAHHRHDVVWHLAWALTIFHERRGHRHDDLAVWQTALDAAAHLPEFTVRTATHRRLGNAYTRLGRHEEAIGHLDQALALARHHHDTIQQAHTHHALSRTWEKRGDDRKALEHARHALDLHRAIGNPAWEPMALNAVGWYAARLGEHDTAREHCQAALALHRQHHSPHGEATTLDSLGFIDHHTGHHQQAIHYFRQALALFRALGHTYDVVDTLDNIGHPHAALGQHEQARAVWQEALEMYREQGRDDDVRRVRRQLDALARLPEPTESAT